MKASEPAIRGTVTAHRDDRIYLEGAYRGQVNGEIQTAYVERGRYEELSDLKYMDTGGTSVSCKPEGCRGELVS